MKHSIHHQLLFLAWAAGAAIVPKSSIAQEASPSKLKPRLTKGAIGASIFLQGDLGSVEVFANNGRRLAAKDSEAAHWTSILVHALQSHHRASGLETFRLANATSRSAFDGKLHQHVRFEQVYEGLPVVDAALVMHINDLGQVYAINGEPVAQGSVDTVELVTCE